MGVRIAPDFTVTGTNTKVLSDSLDKSLPSRLQYPSVVPPAKLPIHLLQHHAVREIQTVALTLQWLPEIQTIYFDHVNPGDTFQIVVQNNYPSPPIPYSFAGVASWSIGNYINQATWSIPPNMLQCYGFGTALTQVNSSRYKLVVNFGTCNSSPKFTLLKVIPSNSSTTWSATRTQVHSPVPSGHFNLTVLNEKVSVPYNTDAKSLQSILQSSSPNINVDVSLLSQSAFGGSVWTVTFITPRGDIPLMKGDCTHVVDCQSLVITTQQNGTEEELWFESIPTYMTEIPLDWASNDVVSSVVEVYTNTASGDVIKAACDGSGSAGAGLVGYAKGSEVSCAFTYSTNKTALITAINVTRYAANDTTIVHFKGKGFTAGNSSRVAVMVLNETCTVTSISDSSIYCTVSEVPAGIYKPTVYVPNLGYALYANLSDHLVITQEVFSFSQIGNSVSGGGNITIAGRGFSYHSQVIISYTNNLNQKVQIPCWNLTATPSKLKCTVPPLPADAVSVLYPKAGSNNFNVVNASEHFEVLIDNTRGSPRNYIAYSYSSTPYITSLSPTEISFASSTTLNFTGTQLSGVSSVLVGVTVCKVLSNTGSSLSCFLTRSKNVSQNFLQNIYISVAGKGYAAQSVSTPYLVPQVKRGFHVTNLSTHFGSLYGGNNVTITGVGFLDTNASHYTVTLVQENTPSYIDAYNQILIKLSLKPIGSEFVNCAIYNMSRDTISCNIDATKTQANVNYIVTVSLNNVQSLCADPSVNETSCVYSETFEYSPQLFYMSGYSLTPLNVASFLLHGYLFNPSVNSNEVFIGDTKCTVISATTTSLSVVSPSLSVPLIGNNYSVSVLVANRGYAISNITVAVPLHVYSVNVSSHNISFGGGSMVVVNGAGFDSFSGDQSSQCVTTNHVLLTVHGLTSPLSVKSILSCSTSKLVFLTPNITQYVSPGVSLYTVTSISVGVGAFSQSISNSSFLLQYSRAASPIFHSSINSVSGYAYKTITFNISNPSLFTSMNTSISIGGEPCLSFTTLRNTPTLSSYSCVVPPLSAGFQSILVDVWPYGNAITPQLNLPQFESLLQVNSYSPPSYFKFSGQGGATINITGKGFSDESEVTVCGVPCYSTKPTYDYVTCQLPESLSVRDVKTIARLAIEQESLVQSLTVGTYFVNGWNGPYCTGQLPFVHDGSYSTSLTYYNAWPNCVIGLQAPAGYLFQPSRLRVYPALGTSTGFTSFYFEGSVDNGKTFIVLAQSTLSIHEGWNFVDASQNYTSTWFTHFRYRPVSAYSGVAYCSVAELDFIGVVARNSTSCPVTVTTSNPQQTSSPGSLTFIPISDSPIVKSISPGNGTALGGTNITLFGVNLLPTTYTANMKMSDLSSRVHVTLSGVPCEVYHVTSSAIQCTTGARPPEYVETSVVTVLVEGYGWALIDDRAQYLYIDKWSALTSWLNQEPPLDGDLVYIPDGQVILLDMNTPLLTAVIIEGALYFDPTKDLTMDASYIFVNGGSLIIGTHEHPFEKQVNITLHGDRYKTIEIPYIGAKCMAVASKGVPMSSFSTGIQIPSRYVGELEIHGKVRKRTWTYLQETAVAGTNIIVTSEPVDFVPGEKLVIPGTSLKKGTFELPAWEYEEVVVLKNIDNYHILLQEPLQYTHESEIVYVDGKKIDMRCEVALLTRNIVIQGDDKSYGQLFGAHTVAMMSGIYRIENAEVRMCGQAFNFGRYCTHSHQAGDMEGSYVKANSIHNSFQRAVTTHGTFYWEVRDNVAFNVMGHPFFVEGGTEMYNTFSGNLAILTLPSSALLGSDTSPSSYWTATTLNFWYDNVGVHAMHGFWFQLATMADLGMFRNNTLHHHGSMGFRIYPTYTPASPQTMYNMLSYRNGAMGLFAKSMGDLHHVGHILVENGGDEISIVRYSTVPYYLDLPAIVDVTVIATLGYVNESASAGKFALNAPQWEFFHVRGLTIINYGGGGAITTCNECLDGAFMNQGASTYRFEGIKFINTSKRILWTETQKDIIWDLDGSIAGKPDTMLTKYYPYNNWPDCERLPAHIYDDTTRCKTIRRVAVDSFTPSNLGFKNLLFQSEVGSYNMFFMPLDITGWVTALAINHHYQLIWRDVGHSAQSFAVTYGQPNYLQTRVQQHRHENITIVFSPNRYDYVPYTFELTYNGATKLAPINGSHPIRNMSSSYYINNTLEFGLSTVGAVADGSTPYRVFANSLICPPSGCFIPRKVSPHLVSHLWSNNATWGSLGVPVAGKDVVISSNMSVVLDINTPALGVVHVYGKLSFLQSAGASITLTCKSILVYGVMEIAGKNGTAYPGTANVIITGTIQNSVAPSIGNGIYQGSKVIAVMGQLTAIGRPTATAWTPLRSTVYQGNTTIVLSTAVDWKVGYEIVLSPTGFFNSTGSAYVDSDIVDLVTIKSISTLTDLKTHANYSSITTTSPLLQTHLCHSQNGQSFCGYVGLISRNIKISSRDSETPSSISYGFGAHIFVTDLASFGSGVLNLQYVTLQNMGKLNSDWMAITFDYQLPGYVQQRSIVNGCVFNSSYNFMLYSAGASNLTITDNIVSKAIGGGIYIASSSSNVVIANNLIMFTTQLPSYYTSTFLWNRPFGSYMVLSSSALVHDNVAALSGDTGFYLVQSLFTKNAPTSACANTRGMPYEVNDDALTAGALVWNNEAVGCQVGMTLVTRNLGEVSPSDCAVLSGFKVWRNAHAGFMSVDTVANVLIANSVIAENHIGMSLNFYKFSEDAFSGVYNSIFIALLESSTANVCGLPDSNWKHVCRAVSTSDPLGVKPYCSSILAGSQWQGVGLMLPQFLNSPRTCGVTGQFGAVCDPPTTISRLCALPYNNRYGTVAGFQYTEQIITDVTFVGYSTSSCTSHRTSAVVFNPGQLDQQPAMMISGITWQNTDSASKFGFNTGLQGAKFQGQDFAIIHDFDGSASGTGKPGQILFDNPEYVAPPPACESLSALGLGFYFCAAHPVDKLSSVTPVPFIQYSALWLDYGPQMIQPLIVTHDFPGQNRSASYFGPTFEGCSESGYFSRFPFALAVNTTNYLLTTGTIPADGWNVRWDAPSQNDVTIVQFFIENSDVINVFVGTSSSDPHPIQAKQLLDGSFPTLNSPAGTHTRDPQRRTLTVTMRGGQSRFYSFVEVPVVQVTIRLEMSIENFFSATFIANVATLLGLSASQIKIANVRSGSVIVDFSILPSTTTTTNYTHTITQIHALRTVAKSLNQSVYTGALVAALGVPVLNIGIIPPIPAYRIDVNNVTYTNQTVYELYVSSILQKQNLLKQSGSTNIVISSNHPTAAPLSGVAPADVLSPGAIAGICVGGGLVVAVALWWVLVSYLRRKQVIKRKSQAQAAEAELSYDSPIYGNAARSAENMSPDQRRKSSSASTAANEPKRKSVLNLINVENPLSPSPATGATTAIAALEAQSPRDIPTSPTFGSAMGVAFKYASDALVSTFSQRVIRVSPQSPPTPSPAPAVTVLAESPVNPIVAATRTSVETTTVSEVTAESARVSRLADQASREASVASAAAAAVTDAVESSSTTNKRTSVENWTPDPAKMSRGSQQSRSSQQRRQSAPATIATQRDSAKSISSAASASQAALETSSPSSDQPVSDNAQPVSDTIAPQSVPEPVVVPEPAPEPAPAPKPASEPVPKPAPASTQPVRKSSVTISFTRPDVPDFISNPETSKTVGGLAAPSMTEQLRKKDAAMKELIQKEGRRNSLADK